MAPRGLKKKFKMPWVIKGQQGAIRWYIEIYFNYASVDDEEQNKKEKS